MSASRYINDCVATQQITLSIPVEVMPELPTSSDCLEIISIQSSEAGDLESIYISNFLGFSDFEYIGESYGNHNFSVNINLFCRIVEQISPSTEIRVCVRFRRTC